jgi:hypothetical protein
LNFCNSFKVHKVQTKTLSPCFRVLLLSSGSLSETRIFKIRSSNKSLSIIFTQLLWWCNKRSSFR